MMSERKFCVDALRETKVKGKRDVCVWCVLNSLFTNGRARKGVASYREAFSHWGDAFMKNKIWWRISVLMWDKLNLSDEVQVEREKELVWSVWAWQESERDSLWRNFARCVGWRKGRGSHSVIRGFQCACVPGRYISWSEAFGDNRTTEDEGKTIISSR